MNMFDDMERAKKGARALLEMLEAPDENFQQALDAYAEADGIIEGDFLADVENAQSVLKGVADQSSVDSFLALPLPFQMAILEYSFDKKHFDYFRAVYKKLQDKKLKKEIARRVHILKTQGVYIELPKSKKKAVIHPVETEQPDCLISGYDSYGDQILIYAMHESRIGLKVIIAILNEPIGIKEFDYLEPSRSEFREIVKQLKKQNEKLYTLPQIQARYFLDQAVSRQQDSGAMPPPRFLSALSRFPKIETSIEVHPAYKYISDEIVNQSQHRLAQTGDLHRLPAFAGWILPQEIFYKLNHRINEVNEGKIFINEGQKAQRIQQIIQEELDEYFTLPNRKSWARKLMDSAYLLSIENEDDQALLAMVAAQHLLKPDFPTADIPFCEQLVMKFIAPAINPGQDNSNKSPDSGGIILP